MKLFATLATAAVLIAVGVPVSGAQAQWATVGSPTGHPTYCYGNSCPGQRHVVPQRPYRMPFTQQNVNGRQMVIPPPRHHGAMMGGHRRHGPMGRGNPRCDRNPGDYLGADGRCHTRGARNSSGPVNGGVVGRPVAGQTAPRPNPIKEKYLADCAAYGAPVQELGGGVMNCRREPSVVTIID